MTRSVSGAPRQQLHKTVIDSQLVASCGVATHPEWPGQDSHECEVADGYCDANSQRQLSAPENVL